MSEQRYPIPCRSCGKSLYGAVNYCPYCGVSFAAAPEPELKPDPEPRPIPEPDVTPEPVPISEPDVTPEPVPLHQPAQPPVPPPPPKSEIPAEPQLVAAAEFQSKPVPAANPARMKWIVIVLVMILIAGVAGYYALGRHKTGSSGPGNLAGEDIGPREQARAVALDAVRRGTLLSVSISKIPKLEKVLDAARKLVEISPRYQEQVDSAEKTVRSAQNERDKDLMAYLKKVVELAGYSPDQVSNVLEMIRREDLTPRDKIVVDLMESHVSAERSSGADPKRVLNDFTERFKDYID